MSTDLVIMLAVAELPTVVALLAGLAMCLMSLRKGAGAWVAAAGFVVLLGGAVGALTHLLFGGWLEGFAMYDEIETLFAGLVVTSRVLGTGLAVLGALMVRP